MLSEYLRTYEFVHEFKSTITVLFKTKGETLEKFPEKGFDQILFQLWIHSSLF